MGRYICVTVGAMKKLGLFDNISYKYIIDIIDDHDKRIGGFIDSIECDDIERRGFRFKFYIYACDTLIRGKSQKEYDVNHAIAPMVSEILNKYEDEELGEEEEKLIMLNFMLREEKMLREEEEKKEILSVKNILRWLLC
tara:strand:+ start:152 stop:568 length:417 start_codon:yes stop_codon:yes gene_type:complete